MSRLPDRAGDTALSDVCFGEHLSNRVPSTIQAIMLALLQEPKMCRYDYAQDNDAGIFVLHT